MKTIFRAVLCSTVVVVLTTVQALAAERWHIKCFNVRGQTMPVKALSAGETAFDVKAIKSDDPALLNVKVIHPDTGDELPVKVIASEDEGADYADVKAIESGNKILPVKAITAAGTILSVKAFYNEDTGRYDIKCLGSGGKMLGLKAISPEGEVLDVKGIKDLPGQEELQIEILAHIKAIARS